MLMMRFNVGVWWKYYTPVIQLRLPPAVLAMIGEMAGNTTPDHDQARFASARLNKLPPDERLPQPTTTSVTGEPPCG